MVLKQLREQIKSTHIKLPVLIVTFKIIYPIGKIEHFECLSLD